MTHLSKLPRLLIVIGTLLVGLALAPAVLADDGHRGRDERPAIQTYPDPSAFADDGRRDRTLTFDRVATGTVVDNPLWLGQITIGHSTGAGFTTNADAYAPVSWPNVLAPIQSDGSLALGDTTVAFNRNTRQVGLFLVLPLGSNEDTTWTSSVTATDVKGRSLTVVVAFQGAIGEQQFVGFVSRHKLALVTIGPATKADGTATVLAIDDLSFN